MASINEIDILAVLDGTASPEALQKLQGWAASKPKRARKLEHFRRIYDELPYIRQYQLIEADWMAFSRQFLSSGTLARIDLESEALFGYKVINPDAEYDHFQSLLNQKTQGPAIVNSVPLKAGDQKRPSRTWFIAWIIAVFTLLVILGWALLRDVNKPQSTITTTDGNAKEVKLEDGKELQLDENYIIKEIQSNEAEHLREYEVIDVLDHLMRASDWRVTSAPYARFDGGDKVLINLDQPYEKILENLKSSADFKYEKLECEGCYQVVRFLGK